MRLGSIRRRLNMHFGLVCFRLKGYLVNRYALKEPTGGDLVVDVLLRALELHEKETSARFEKKPESEQEDILIYLHMNWEDLQQDSSVIAALRETNFVTGVDGGIYKPKDLFDPGDALLKSLFSTKIPGKRFVSDRWLSILRKTGLQNTRDAGTVIRCAKRIEFLGAQSMKDDTEGRVSKKIWSLAETLIQIVFENSALLQDHNFCSVFCKIEFVPAEKGLPFTSGKKKNGLKRVFCSYNNAILLKDWPLAWSVAPIISKYPPDYSWGALQLRSPPPFTLVLEHLQSKASKFVSCISTMEEATFEVLKYLYENWDTFSCSDIINLSKLPFIPTANVVTHFHTASSFVTQLTIDLWPIAHELPLRYLPFVKILKELGLHDKLSISSGVRLISRRRHYLLDPNKLRAVIEILNFICDAIENHKPGRPNWKSKLFVPDNNCRLVRANSCLYIDPLGSRYLKYIDSSKLTLVHPDVSERLCLAFGIRKLSDIVVEQLDGVEHLLNLEEIGSVSLATIRLKLLSKSFQVAVSSVVSNYSSIGSGFKNPDFLTLQRSLDSIAERLRFVQSIYTRFWLLPNSLDITLAYMDFTIPEWESESSHRALYYIDHSNTCMLIAEPPSYVSVIDLVAIVVSHVLGSPVPLPIGSLFLCPQHSETELVNILKLSSDGRERGCVLIGGDIVPEDALQVQLKPLRPFYKGEIVAWKNQNGDKLLKYGRIVEDVRPSAGQPLYRFNLETSPWKTETIISSHVFSFANFSMAACKSSTYRHAIKELDHGHVPTKEFVEALEEMLSVAGISMDTDKQRLYQNIKSLKERLNESQATLVREQEKLETARKEVHAAGVALLCRICLTEEVDITIVPCGHVLCRRCRAYGVSRCPFCRVKISTTVRIYRC